MKNSIIPLLLFIPIVGFSQIRERLNSTDIERHSLKANVKELIHKEYRPIFSNDSTYTLKLGGSFTVNHYQLNFDQKGYLKTKTILEKKDDSLIKDHVWLYTYDENNRIIQEKKIFSRFSPKDTTSLIYEYVGDTIINIRRSGMIFNGMLYSYKQEGKIEYNNVINADSSYISRKVIVYDKFDRIIQSEDYKNTDFIKDFVINTYLDTISKLKFKKVWIMPEHNHSSYYEFEYDKNGNQIKRISGNFKNNETTIIRYEYIYDKKENWIEKRFFSWRGTLVSVYRREIKYYQ